MYRFPYPWVEALDTESLPNCTVYEPGEHTSLVSQSLEEAVRDCLEKPAGCPPLATMLRDSSAKKVLILVDDMTRPTPQRRILPALLSALGESGIRSEDICVVIATGLHRGMDTREIRDRFGEAAVNRVKIVNHNACDRENLVSLGAAEDGTPVLVNRMVREHDFIIAVGCIEPHRVAGFSGSSKMVQPGICGEQITASVHWRGWSSEGKALYGIADNPIRREMHAIGEKAGLRFILNVVLGTDGRPYRFFAGDPWAAFMEGCKEVRRMASVTVQSADIVVVDSYPFDIDLWQACKGISVAELVVRPGGTIILATPCPEGLGAHGRQIMKTGYLPYSEVVRRVNEGSFENLTIACHLAALGRILERGELLIVSPGLDRDLLKRVGLRSSFTVSEAIDEARARLGPGAEIAVLKNACSMIPSTRNSAPK